MCYKNKRSKKLSLKITSFIRHIGLYLLYFDDDGDDDEDDDSLAAKGQRGPYFPFYVFFPPLGLS